MSNYFYNGIDISTIISTSHPYNGTSQTILTNTYGSFSQISNITISNSNFDKCLSVNTGYAVNGTDIANQLPSKVVLYQAQLDRNTITIPKVPANGYPTGTGPFYTNAASLQAVCSFNSPASYTLNIDPIYNSIGVILCGGGGGGGGSGQNNVNNTGPRGGGGGGGFLYARSIDLNTKGRSWVLTVGGGGQSGFFFGTGGNFMGGTGGATDATSGGETRLYSQNNAFNDYMSAGGGGGGISSNSGGTLAVSGANLSSGISNVVSYNSVAANNANYPLGGTCRYTSATTTPINGQNYISGLYNSIDISFNSTYTTSDNNPGVPGGTNDANNTYGSHTAGGGFNVVQYYRNGTNPTNGAVNSLSDVFGKGGVGAPRVNATVLGNPGGPGSPGFALIYYYL